MDFESYIGQLQASGNYRSVPADRSGDPVVDFSTNDYLGLGMRIDLQRQFFARDGMCDVPLTSSASRLLAATQNHYNALEARLGELYGRDILLFNSGYHANTGIIPALTDSSTLIVADKLVHASIIDGMMLSKCRFTRFRHNDFDHLEQILARAGADAANCLVIVESVYSMDGDSADMERLIEIKRRFPQILLYVDEAHAFGVCGKSGLGLAASSSQSDAFDVIVGTFGKAAASMGAFCAVSAALRDVIVNRARSFIFSTALPPLNAAWTLFMVDRIVGMDTEREHLRQLSAALNRVISPYSPAGTVPGHIQPLIVGDARRAVELSRRLEAEGFKALPIRTPTVPPGTERLRFSLSASMDAATVCRLGDALERIMK